MPEMPIRSRLLGGWVERRARRVSRCVAGGVGALLEWDTIYVRGEDADVMVHFRGSMGIFAVVREEGGKNSEDGIVGGEF